MDQATASNQEQELSTDSNLDPSFNIYLRLFCDRFQGKLKKEEIEPIFNPISTLFGDSKDSNQGHSIYMMPIVPDDENMINDFVRIRSQGGEGCSQSSKEFMKYYGEGILSIEESRKVCKSKINGMWKSDSLPLEMVFLVYDKEKEVDKEGRREASLLIGADTNGSKGGIITAGQRDEQGNIEENPDLFCIALEQDSGRHLGRKSVSIIIKLFQILHEKKIYGFDGVTATAHPDNKPSEEIIKRSGFEFRCQENRNYLIAECKLRNVYDYKFDRDPKIPVTNEVCCGNSTIPTPSQTIFSSEHAKDISQSSSE